MAMRTGAAGSGVHMRKAARWRLMSRPTLRANDLPYQEIGAFLRDLRQEQGVIARALEFIVLTACRLEEACQAAWHEVDLQARVWTIPAERAKSGKAHRVPLSDAAITVLTQVLGLDSTCVFPGIGRKEDRHRAFQGLLQRLGRPVAALRGGRVAFRDWARNRTQYSRTKTAMALCLGHAVQDELPSASYCRPDRFDDCRRLMADWALWCATAQPGA